MTYSYREYDGPPPSRSRRRGCASRMYTRAWDGFCGKPYCSYCGQEYEDDEEALRDTEYRTYHIALKDHQARIKKGDLYARVTGFLYEVDGPRVDYFGPTKRLVAKAPGTEGHDPKKWAKGMEKRERQLERRRARDARRREREQVKGLGKNA